MSVSSTGDDLSQFGGRRVIFAVLASLFGWGLDLFDLFLLLYVAPTIGKLFFPSSHPMLSLAAVYGSFAATLLVRPLGSALFGSYADRWGRRRAMMVAVIGVGLFTASLGLVPTVQTIGIAASIVFLVLKLVQGLFVGGVVASSHTIGTETVPERWRGLLSGAVGGGGSAIGGLLASTIYFFVSVAAPGAAFVAWGWRLMFLSGLITSIVGVFLFRNLEESPLFQQLNARKAARRNVASPREAASPVRQLLSRSYRAVFGLNLMMTVGAGAGFYLTSGYMPTFLRLVNGIPRTQASLILICLSLAGALGAMLTGEISEHFGRKPVFIAMALVRLVAFPALFFLLAGTTDMVMIGVYACLMAFICNGSYGPLLIFLNERFPTSLRATGTGLSWNVGYAAGGTLPIFVSLAAIGVGGKALPLILACFTTVVTLIYLVGAILIPETRGRLDLVEHEEPGQQPDIDAPSLAVRT